MHSPPFVSNCRHFFLSPPLFCCISHASYLGHCSYPRWLDLIYNSPYCSCHSLFLLISAALVFTGRDLFCSSCPAYESLSPLYYSWPIHQSFLSFSFPPFSLSFLLPSFIVASYSLPSTLFIHYADILLTYIIIYWLSFSFFLPFPFLLFYISISLLSPSLSFLSSLLYLTENFISALSSLNRVLFLFPSKKVVSSLTLLPIWMCSRHWQPLSTNLYT